MTTTVPPTDPRNPETYVPELTRPETMIPEIPEEITTLFTGGPTTEYEATASERAVSDGPEPEDVSLSPVVSERDQELAELNKPTTDYPVVATQEGTEPVLVIEDAVLVTNEPVVATEEPVVATDEPVVETEAPVEETEAPVKTEAEPTEEVRISSPNVQL